MMKNLLTLASCSTVLTTVLVSSAFAVPQDIELKPNYKIPHQNLEYLRLKQPPVPSEPEFPRFLGTSTRLDENEALLQALRNARQKLSLRFPNDPYGNVDPYELNYLVLKKGKGTSRDGTIATWILIELVPKTEQVVINCPQPTEPGVGVSCQPQVRTSYLRNPNKVRRSPQRR